MNASLHPSLTTHRPLRAVAAWPLILMLMAAVVSQAVAAPSQIPLTNRSAPPPAPNVMMTIDDSGSMLSDAMPEGAFVLNGKSVT